MLEGYSYLWTRPALYIRRECGYPLALSYSATNINISRWATLLSDSLPLRGIPFESSTVSTWLHFFFSIIYLRRREIDNKLPWEVGSYLSKGEFCRAAILPSHMGGAKGVCGSSGLPDHEPGRSRGRPFTPQIYAWPLAWAKTKSQTLNSSLLCGWQGPDDLIHLCCLQGLHQ